ncbi:quinone oxidoreductase [Fusarium phyllophilum]|uniref:Quinone oxidoreductase n=1 Tax=Fusarium phyllophilum TaxID=47803 RepID=A0A8H5JW73_9HYPO|nr:quinone oxidoreductase [Fusarium phyllophilum]
MYGASVTKWGETPKYVELDDPAPPDSGNEIQVKVSAVCLHNLVRARVKGIHYPVKDLPHIPGVDVVRTTSEGPVYFITYFSVLILGAISASRKIAIPRSRRLGAGKVIGCARSSDRLGKLDLDKKILLKMPATETDFSMLEPVDFVLDYVYGKFTSHLLQFLSPSHFCQYIQVGSMADPRSTLNASILRSKNIIIMGSGIGSFTESELRAELPDLLEAMAPLSLESVAVSSMSDVETQWERQETERLVFSLKIL